MKRNEAMNWNLYSSAEVAGEIGISIISLYRFMRAKGYIIKIGKYSGHKLSSFGRSINLTTDVGEHPTFKNQEYSEVVFTDQSKAIITKAYSQWIQAAKVAM